MGNSSMKCFPCSMSRTVNVVLLSGETAEFREPVRASTVMKRYPQHVVLHCSMASNRGMGQRRNISVLKPEQSLKRNQNYLITPIQTANNSKSFLDSWAFFKLGTLNDKLNAKIRHKTRTSGPNRRSWIQTVFDKIFGSRTRSYHSLDDDDDDDDCRSSFRFIQPSFGSYQPSFEPRTRSGSLDYKRPSLGSYQPSFEPRTPLGCLDYKRPSLESISESPTSSRNSSFAG